MMRVGIFLYALVVALMVGASSWLGEREIVFPEVAALAVVPFLLPEDILLLYPVMIALGAIGLTLASRVLQELSASCD